MKTYFIQIAIGPVQEFIASARKLRDLWFGSYYLSELSKTIARSLHERGAKLIFPSIDDGQDGRQIDAALERDSDLVVANKILVSLQTDLPVEVVVSEVKAAWQAHIMQVADDALKSIKKIRSIRINEELYIKQRSDVGEFFAVWVEQKSDESYDFVKNKLDALMAARKNYRPFIEFNWNGAGIPKNSLDGVREAVVGDGQPEIRGLLKKNERLDAMGVIKRFASKDCKIKFDDLSQIAMTSFRLKQVGGKNAGLIESFAAKCDHTIDADSDSWGSNLDFFYFDKNQMKQQGASKEYRQMKKICGEPHKYACILLGDGDNVGTLLDGIKEQKQHALFSRELGKFSNSVRRKIETYHGSLIYAGGDDVLAYLPLFSAIECADAIRNLFYERMSALIKNLGLESSSIPTFSIGLAIVHHSEPLDIALNIARKAEKLAKQESQRNSLAVIQHKRGGSDLEIFGKWETIEASTLGLAERLKLMASLHDQNILPSTLGYQLRNVIKETGDAIAFKIKGGKLLPLNAASTVVMRVFNQKQEATSLRQNLQSILADSTSIRKLSSEMILAKQFAEDKKIYKMDGDL